MKAIAILVLTALAQSLPGQDAVAVKIIANPAIAASEITRDELNDIFLRTKTSFAGLDYVEPVLEKKGPSHEEFLKLYIAKTDAGLMTYYRSLMFTGKASIPRSFSSDAALVAYVAKTKGAIGYVNSASSTPGVKVLKVK